MRKVQLFSIPASSWAREEEDESSPSSSFPGGGEDDVDVACGFLNAMLIMLIYLLHSPAQLHHHSLKLKRNCNYGCPSST